MALNHLFINVIRSHIGSNKLSSVHKCLSQVWFRVQSRLGHSIFSDTVISVYQMLVSINLLSYRTYSCNSDGKRILDNDGLCRGDAEMVMERLGIFCNPEGGELKDRMSSDDFKGLFEEKEPSLEEVKEAFDVFDENMDGFINASELQRVLCILGFKEGSDLENCKKMIRAFDKNSDERIDFNEFVKFMENIFC